MWGTRALAPKKLCVFVSPSPESIGPPNVAHHFRFSILLLFSAVGERERLIALSMIGELSLICCGWFLVLLLLPEPCSLPSPALTLDHAPHSRQNSASSTGWLPTSGEYSSQLGLERESS